MRCRTIGGEMTRPIHSKGIFGNALLLLDDGAFKCLIVDNEKKSILNNL